MDTYDSTTKEEYEIKRELETLELQDNMKSAYEEELQRTEELLKNFREMLKEIVKMPETQQKQMKADVIRLLVRELTVETLGTVKNKRDYRIHGNMRLGAAIPVSTWGEFNRC